MANNLGASLVEKSKENIRLKDELKKQKLEYKVLHEQLVATELDRDYHKAKWDLIQKGALVYITSDGFIIEAMNIPNDFETTFPQIIDFEVIKTSLYQRYAYYKVEDGNVIIDQDKYKKYKGAILL